MVEVGIDDIALAVPAIFVDMSEFEKARGQELEDLRKKYPDGKFSNGVQIPTMEPGKVTKGIGLEKMSVPDLHQDAAVLAANAVLQLMQRNDLEPEQICRLDISTESGVDESKSMGAYVSGMLEKVYGDRSFRRVNAGEKKFACVSGMQNLLDAAAWIESGRGRGRHAIVVASDIARYPRVIDADEAGTGEYTQGAGAVAMLVKENPRLLRLDPISAFSLRDEADFFRPIGRDTAVVYGHYSNECYLEAMREAFDDYRQLAEKTGVVNISDGNCLTDVFGIINFHIPYPKMAEYASAMLFRHEWRGLPRMKEINSQIGCEPERGEFFNDELFKTAHDEHLKRFRKTPQFKKAYQQKVEPTLKFSTQIGNTYTGSLFVGLMGGFVSTNGSRNLAGTRAGLGGYGSGRLTVVTSGVVPDGYREVVDKFNPQADLDRREKIPMNIYDALHERQLKASIRPPQAGEFFLKEVRRDGYRVYERATL